MFELIQLAWQLLVRRVPARPRAVHRFKFSESSAVTSSIAMEVTMNAHLKLVSDHPVAAPSIRHNGQALHHLADQLTTEIRAGRSEVARVLASLHHLSPFGIAIVARWMAKSGLSEGEILNTVVE